VKQGRLWRDLGPEKTELLERLGFGLCGMEFIDPVSQRRLPYPFVRDETISRLRIAILALKSKPSVVCARGPSDTDSEEGLFENSTTRASGSVSGR
jgi:hypothetical protein